MEKVEIELKFPLKNAEKLIEELEKISESTEVYQKDTYFVPMHRNFLEAVPISEWLRVRETEKEFNINYKNWHNKENSQAISCDEFETGFEDVNALKRILENLDFKEIIVVEKRRRNWSYNNTIISIDRVAGLGDYIEIEADGEFESIEHAKVHLHNTLHSLDAKIREQDFRGYPYLVLERKGFFNKN